MAWGGTLTLQDTERRLFGGAVFRSKAHYAFADQVEPCHEQKNLRKTLEVFLVNAVMQPEANLQAKQRRNQHCHRKGQCFGIEYA